MKMPSKSMNIISLIFMFSLMSFVMFQKKAIRVFLIGDSTISIKETYAYPETGWGMPFVHFFDSTVVVENHAKNGRSTPHFYFRKQVATCGRAIERRRLCVYAVWSQ